MLGLSLAFFLFGFPHSNDEAVLLRQAGEQVQAAQQAETKSYVEAFRIYKIALEKIEKIESEHADSEIAHQIAIGKAKFGSYTFSELKETVLPKMKLKSDAEEKPLYLLLLLAEIWGDPMFQANSKGIVARKLAESGRLEESLEIAKGIGSLPTKVWIYSILVSKLTEKGEKNKAGVLLSQSIQEFQNLQTIPRGMGDDYKSNTLISIARAYGEQGEKDKALLALSEAVRELEQIKLVSRKISLLIMISHEFWSLGEKEKAENILELWDNTKIDETGIGPAEVLTQVAGQYAEIGKKDKAKDLLARAFMLAEEWAHQENVRLRVETIAEIAEKYNSIGEKDKASNLLAEGRKMISTMVKDNNHFKADALDTIAREYIKLGDKKEALSALGLSHQEIRAFRTSVNDNRLEILARTYVLAGETDKAIEITKEMDSTWSKQSVLSDIAEKYIKQGEEEKASQIISNLSQSESGVDDRRNELFAISYAQSGNLAKSAEITETLKDPDDKSWALIELSKGYENHGKKTKAEEYLNQASHLSTEIKFGSRKVQTLINIARQYKEMGNINQASEILSQAQHLTNSLEVNSFNELLLLDILRLYAEIGQYENAVQLIDLLHGKDSNLFALVEIAESYAKAQNKERSDAMLAEALQIANQMKDPQEKSSALIKIAKIYVLHKKDRSKELLSEASVINKTIKDNRDRLSTLTTLAEQYNALGEKEQALDDLAQASRIAKEIKAPFVYDSWFKGVPHVVTAISKGYLKTKDYGQALELAHKVEQDYSTISVMPDLARIYADAGNKEKARQILHEGLAETQNIKLPYDRGHLLAAFAEAYIESGEQNKGKELLFEALKAAKDVDHAFYKTFMLARIVHSFGPDEKADKKMKIPLHQILQEIK